jgi:sulfite reductase beta subunit-like hemoprotein
MTTTFWPNYLFFVDMSDEATELAAIPEGPLSASNATLLAAALSTHDTGEGRALWTDQPADQFTTQGATVQYNGANKTGLPSNALFTNVLILAFPWAGPAPRNVMGLHYNVTPPAPTPTPSPSAT